MAHSYAPAPWTPGSVVSFEDRDWLVWSNAPSATAVWLHADDGTFVLVKKPTTRRGTGIPARRVGGHDEAVNPVRLAETIRRAKVQQETITDTPTVRRFSGTDQTPRVWHRETIHATQDCTRTYRPLPHGAQVTAVLWRDITDAEGLRHARTIIEHPQTTSGAICPCIHQAAALLSPTAA